MESPLAVWGCQGRADRYRCSRHQREQREMQSCEVTPSAVSVHRFGGRGRRCGLWRLEAQHDFFALVDVDRDRARRGPACRTAIRRRAPGARCPGSGAPSGARPSADRSLSSPGAPSAPGEVRFDFLLRELLLELHQELVHTRRMMSWSSARNEITASRRFLNSGVNIFLIAFHLVAGLHRAGEAHGVLRQRLGPALVVMTITMLRKSAFLPLLSVSVPWSITCSRMLKTSGCGLLDLVKQQHRVGLLGDRLGEQPAPARSRRIRAARRSGGCTACRSMYSDMSKRISSMPMQ